MLKNDNSTTGTEHGTSTHEGLLNDYLLRTLMRQVPIVVGGNLVALTINLSVYNSALQTGQITWILSLMLISIAGRGVTALAYQFRWCQRDRVSFWLGFLVGFALLNGISWGYFCILVLAEVNFSNAFIVLLTAAGMVGASISTSAASRLVLIAYAVPALGLMAVATALNNGPSQITTVLMIIAYLCFILLAGFNINALMRKSISYGLKNKDLVHRLHRLSSEDSLTGLANRRAFDGYVDTAWSNAVEQGSSLALVTLDIDYFKQYNDAYGHQQGDVCLCEVADVLKTSDNPDINRLAARYGGEEFTVLLCGADDQDARKHAEFIRAQIENVRIPHEYSDAASVVTVSIAAVSVSPGTQDRIAELFRRADIALYEAKRLGRNRVVARSYESFEKTPLNSYMQA